MARKTFLAGEAAVKLIPNAKDFHVKARSDLAKNRLNTGVELRPNISRKFRSDAKTQLDKIKLSVPVHLRADATGFRREAQAKIDAGAPLKLAVKLEAKADRASVTAARTAMQSQLDSMRPLQIAVEANTSRAHLELIRWRTLQQNTPLTVRVNADTGDARQEMQRLRSEERAANDRRKLNSRQSGSGTSGGGGGGQSMYQKVRSAAIGTGIVFAPIVSQASIGGLIAIAGAASQAGAAVGLLPAIAVAATAGFAALGIGMSGISGAFEAIAAETEAAGTASGTSGSAVAGAARQVASAERSLTRAQENVTRAQKDLNDARKMAVRRLRDMNDQLDMAPINERQAALAIKEAKRALADAMKSGDSLEIEGAQIDLDRSYEDFDQLKKQNQDLASDTAAANRAGIEGDAEVIEAKRGVVDANAAVLDAQDGLTSAIEAQTEALKGNTAAADKAAAAMAKLSPNARAFVTAMRALGPEWTELRKAVQDKLFEGLGSSVTDLAGQQLPVLKQGLEGIASLLNVGVRNAIGVFSSDSAVADFTTTLNNSKGLWSGIADSFTPLSQAFIDLSTVGSSFMPRMGEWIRSNAQQFGDWINKMRESGELERMFNQAIEVAKQLGRIIGDVLHIVGDLFSAGADTGGGFLNTIETITSELRAFTESTEGQESMRLFFQGVGEAVRTLAPILTIVAKTIFDTLGPALTDLVIGMGPGLVAVFEGLRMGLQAIAPVMPIVGEAIGTIGRELGEVFVAIGPVIAEALTAIAPLVQPIAQLINGLIQALLPFMPVLTAVLTMVIETLVPVFENLLESMAPFIALAAESVMPVIATLAEIFGKLAAAMMPVVTAIMNALMPLLPVLYDVLDQLVGIIGEQLIGVIEMIAPLLPQIAEAFIEIVIALLPLLPPLLEAAFNLLPALIQVFLLVIPIILRVVDVFVALVNYLVPILIPVIETVSSVVSTVFNAIADVISWVFNVIVMPIFNVMTGVITDFGDSMNWLWHNIIEPVWNGISAAIEWAWKNVIEPVWNSLMEGLGKVGGFFTATVDGIKSAWNKLMEIARAPIVWVIDKVINGGIGGGWKAVDNFLGGVLPDWQDVALPNPAGMAKGGPVPMEAGARAGADSVLRNLMPGEFVLSVPAVRALGMDNLSRFNAAARGGQNPQNEGLLPIGDRMVNKRLQSTGQWGLAPGGEVTKDDPAWKAIKEGMDYAQRHQPRPYVWGGSTFADGGTDCSGWMSEIADVVLGGSGGHRKWATGSFPGGGGSQGDKVNAGGQMWEKGLRAGMSIGVSVPHTAGTIGGLPGLPATGIESGGNTGQGNTFGPPATNADDPQFPTQYHLPIIDGEFITGAGGTSNEQKRRGVTRVVEKMINGIIDPIYGTIRAGVGDPPPAIRAIPEQIYNGQVKPAKKYILDKVSEFTSLEGWENRVSGAAKGLWEGATSTAGKVWDAATPWDTGGILPPGLNVVGNKTGTNEYILTPGETSAISELAKALDGTKALLVNIGSIGGEAISKADFLGGASTVTTGSAPSSSQGMAAESPDYTDPSTSGSATPSMGPQTQKEKTIAAIIAEGKAMGMSDDDIRSGIATTLVEAEGEIYANESVPESMNIAHTAVGSDHDSVGPFQQRNSWGSAEDRMDPNKSARKYFESLKGIEGRDSMSIGERAQAVQRSAYPDKYDTRADEANQLFGQFSKSNPVPVEVMPTTADTTGRDVTEGEINGQPLQGAAIDNTTGEYLPENNTPPSSETTTTPTDSLAVHRENGLKVGKSFASTLGFGGQAQLIEDKAPVVGELGTAIGEAAPAYAAALAGNPALLTAQIGKSTAAWATKTASDFSSFGIENAGGILESAMSMFGAPLIAGGTVNIGASEQQVQSALEDQNNRRARRTKEGRKRRP